MAANFLNLPNELILYLGEMLPDSSLNSLLLANRRFAELLNPILWKFSDDDGDCSFFDLLFPSETKHNNTLDLLRYAVAADNGPMAQKVLRICNFDYATYGDPIDEALCAAVENGHQHWLEVLLNKVEEQHQTLKSATLNSLLFTAVEGGNILITQRLLGHGEISLGLWETLCQDIVRAKNHRLLRVFLDHAQPDGTPTTENINSLFRFGVSSKHTPTMEVLVRHVSTPPGPEPIISMNRLYPLHLAVLVGDREMVAWLLDHGFDINARGYRGRTATHMAARNADLLRLLVSRGADVYLRDSDGKPALAEAALAKTPDSFNYLLSIYGNLYCKPEDIGWFSYALSNASCREIISFLVDRIDMEVFGEEIIRRTVESYSITLLRALVARGASLGARFQDGKTILHHYARRNFFGSLGKDTAAKVTDAARFVLDTRPEILHEVDVYGNTPLHLAVNAHSRPILQTFLERGASPVVPNHRGYTPIELGQNFGQDICELLRSYAPAIEE